MSIILPGATIGILGGGQLGRMMALAAKAMGYRIAVLETKSDSPCAQVADEEIVCSYDDLEGAKKLAEVSDVITFEFENIPPKTVRFLSERAYLPQGEKVLATTRDREWEKKAIVEAGAKVARYRIVHDEADFHEALQAVGLPAVLKTCRGGYDGKGQIVLKNAEDVHAASTRFVGKQKVIVEALVPFEKEISVVITRSVNGEVDTFPVVENIHVDNILHKTIAPARISGEIIGKATDIAYRLADYFSLIGTLCVEMFLTKDGEIYVNELAPRPHNSGHFTIDACETSQFEQHIRAICGWPLGKTTQLQKAVMVNILGQHLKGSLEQIPHYDHVKYHLYGKEDAKPQRKMGHFTVLADSVEQAYEKADRLHQGQSVLETEDHG